MKNTISIKNIAFCLLLLVTFLFQACEDDESFDVVGNPNNIVYILPATKSFDMVTTPVGFFGDSIYADFGVKSTNPMKESVTVTATIDNSLVSTYNEKNDTDYMACTASLAKATATISEGEYASFDSIKVILPKENYPEIEEVGSYLVPVKLSGVSTGIVSAEYNVVYLAITTTYSNCKDQATSVSGTKADRTGWTASVNGSDIGSRLFDNNRWSYYYTTSLPFTIEIDLGSVHNDITGFDMSYFSEYYGIGSADVYTSETTTDEYELQGSPGYLFSSTQYVSFYETVNTRYIKIVINSSSYDSGVVMTEFNLYAE